MKEIKVSVICITYNQAGYIRDALNSFIMQKTDFDFEILVHDDASTDGTREIVLEYEKKYPDIIKAVCQNENQYSKGKGIISTFLLPIVKGKYIAFCEGDDYWTDENKLQKQYNVMENDPNCYLCAHAANTINAKTKAITGIKGPLVYKETYGMKEAIQGFGRWVATASMFVRRELLDNFPTYASIAPCGDYIYPIIAAERGGYVYLPDNMAVYRVQANNSLSQSWTRELDKLFRYYKKYEKMLFELDKHTGGEYKDEIEEEYTRIWFAYYSNAGDKRVLKEDRFKKYFDKFSIKRKIYTYIKIYFPVLRTLYFKYGSYIKSITYFLKKI